MRGGTGCGFILLKNAGPRPAPHKEGEKKKKGRKENLIVDSLIHSFHSALFFSPPVVTKSQAQPSPSRPSALTAPHG